MSLILETERLNLREFALSDAQFLYELNSDPEVIIYTGDPPFDSLEDARQFIREYDHYQKHGYGRWAVILKSDNRFLGWCGLKYNELSKVDIGFRFFRKYWGIGYALESARACIKYGFEDLGLEEIIARTQTDNHRSIKLIKELNMRTYKSGYKESSNWVYYKIGRKGFL